MVDKQYEDFRVSVMWCQMCKKATNTREFLVLQIDNTKYFSCRCEECGIQVGTKKESDTTIDGIS